MGSSTNQSSPKTPNWRIANAVLGNPNVSPERQHQELWRAAIGDQGDALAEALGNPLLGNACALSTRSKSPSDAIQRFEKSLLHSHNAGLILDLGKRALVRTVAAEKGDCILSTMTPTRCERLLCRLLATRLGLYPISSASLRIRWRVSTLRGYFPLDKARETVETETLATWEISAKVTVTLSFPLLRQRKRLLTFHYTSKRFLCQYIRGSQRGAFADSGQFRAAAQSASKLLVITAARITNIRSAAGRDQRMLAPVNRCLNCLKPPG